MPADIYHCGAVIAEKPTMSDDIYHCGAVIAEKPTMPDDIYAIVPQLQIFENT